MSSDGKLRELYDCPFYYEVAFGFRDISKEVDFFEKCIKKFSKIPVKKVLDVGCGPCPYMIELVKRGYTFFGLDLSKAMLDYSLEKARKAEIKIETIWADMCNFATNEKFDFVFCMLGSISIESNRQFLSHLDSVANCLRNGGIYLIDASINFDWTQLGRQEWTVAEDGLTLNVVWEQELVSLIEQKVIDRVMVKATGKGGEKVLKTEKVEKVIFPQEFLELVKKNGKFEFLGWYNNFNLDEPLEKAKSISRPITLLRRK